MDRTIKTQYIGISIVIRVINTHSIHLIFWIISY